MAKTEQEKEGRSKRENVIVFDFDGVIHGYRKGFHDGTIYDTPVNGIQDILDALRSRGYKIVIYSSRCHSRFYNGKYQDSQIKEMEKWMKWWGVPYDEIYTGSGKPVCKLFVDDNAYRFDKDEWNSYMVEEIIDLTK